MADVRWEVYIRQDDGTDFSSANEPGAAVRLRTSTSGGGDGGEYTGNVAGSGAFSETGNGLWYIYIDSDDSGYYVVETYTTASGSWTTVNGMTPIYITLEGFLPLGGGTMTGNIVMGDNSITGIDTLTFTDTAGTVAGIENGNLLDKSANETISGDWACTGFFDITASKLKIGGTAMTMTAGKLNTLSDVDTGESDKIYILQRGLSTNVKSDTTANYTILRADLGGVLPCTTNGVVDTIVTLPTISSSANSGSTILIRFKTDGGTDLVVREQDGGFITPAGATGTDITFADAGDWCYLISPGVTGGKWGLILNEGGTLA